MEKTIEIFIEVLLFLIASYFIFYQAFLKKIGQKVAELVTEKQLTEIRETVKSEFKSKMETHKAELSLELSKRIEPLKSELAKGNISHQIEYGNLYIERTKVIREMYARLQELHSAMAWFTAQLVPVIEDTEKEEQERKERINKALNEFQNYYVINKLFFDKEFCDFVDGIFKTYWDLGWEYGFKSERLKSAGVTDHYIDIYIKETTKISKQVREDLPKKIEELENKFREILGVS